MQAPLEIIALVAKYFGLRPSHLKGKRRPENICVPRQIAMLLLRERGLTTTAVGVLLRRDHSTVLWGTQSITDRLSQDYKLFLQVEMLRRTTTALYAA